MDRTTPSGVSAQSDIGATLAASGLRRFALPLVFAALVAVGSYIRVPIPGNPVPFTLQVVFVLLAGAFLTPRAAAASMGLFLSTGLLGVPVFSGGGAGPAYLLGPTGGYLVGFVAGASLCAWLIRGRADSIAGITLAMSVALLTIYVFGAAHLTVYLGGDLAAGIRLGILPFLPVGLAKLAIAVAVASAGSNLNPRSSDASR